MLKIAAGIIIGSTVVKIPALRKAWLINKLKQVSRTADGEYDLIAVSQQLRKWEVGVWPISPELSAVLYRTMANLVATAVTNDIITGRREVDGAGDDDPLDTGFDPLDPAEREGPRPRPNAEGNATRVRRGQRRRAASTIYYEVVAEIGLRPDVPGQRDVVMDVATRILKDMRVRIRDRPDVLADVMALYFTPRASQLRASAVLNSPTTKMLQKEAYGMAR